MSTNISKQKRDVLLAKIQEIKSFIETAPQDQNTANLLSYIGELTKEVNGKKYGLVFEEHREKIDEMLEENAPVLVEDEDLFIDNGGEMNFLIEGDNLAALKLLEKTHKGKIDVIYIDPPYNTGNKDFIYDDDYVDADDNYKHSKWISFMEKRLRYAYSILAPTGCIFISINEVEQAQLKIMCDNIFGENNLLSVHYIQSRYADKDVANNGADWLPIIEYVYIYSKDTYSFELNKPSESYDFSPYHFSINELESGKIIDMNGKKVEIFRKGQYEIIDDKVCSTSSLKEVWASGSLLKQKNTAAWYYNEYLLKRLDEDGLDCLYKIYGIGEDGLGYRYVKGPARADKIRGKIYQGAPKVKVELENSGKGAIKYKPIINYYDFSPDFGNIANEGGIAFNSGKKPVKMLKQFINYHKDKDVTVLDFFAGSASTGHAVWALNKEDGGHRKFILCTSSEKDICKSIAYKRLCNVINQEFYPASLKYLKIDYVPIKDKMYYEYADELLEHVKELVELENAIDFKSNKSVAIVLDDDEFDDFVEHIDDYPECKTLYKGHDVLTSWQQEQIIKAHGISINVVPDYYYRDLAD